MQQFSRQPKEEPVCIRMDITVDLPKELANEVECLGIYRFDKCTCDGETKRMTASVSTKFYRVRKGA